VFSYLLAGMAVYGAIGWLIGRAVHVSLLFPIGMLVGLAISLGFIIYRYGRVGPGGRPPGGDKEMNGDR
jgi:ATP synthase protein I